jgi:hypothetical protein
MNTATVVMLLVSTLAASVAAIAALLSVGQARLTAFYESQSRQLAHLADRRDRLFRVGSLVEEIIHDTNGDHRRRSQHELRQAIIGLGDLLPSCVEAAQQPHPSNPTLISARGQVERELRIVLAASEITEDQVPPAPWWTKYVTRNADAAATTG